MGASTVPLKLVALPRYQLVTSSYGPNCGFVQLAQGDRAIRNKNTIVRTGHGGFIVLSLGMHSYFGNLAAAQARYASLAAGRISVTTAGSQCILMRWIEPSKHHSSIGQPCCARRLKKTIRRQYWKMYE